MALFKKTIRYLVIIGTVTLLGFIILIIFQQRELDKHRVSVDEAKLVVEQFAKDSGWEKGEIRLKEPLYNLNNKVEVYLFTYWVDGRYEQYIIVAAKRTYPPILEFSQNEPYAGNNSNEKGFYFGTSVVYEKSRFSLIAKRWFFIPFMPRYFMEFNIRQKVERNKSYWSYYLD